MFGKSGLAFAQCNMSYLTSKQRCATEISPTLIKAIKEGMARPSKIVLYNLKVLNIEYIFVLEKHIRAAVYSPLIEDRRPQ